MTGSNTVRFTAPGRMVVVALLVGGGLAALAYAAAPPASAQGVFITRGPGSQIGVSVRDVDAADGRGVLIERVRPGSPAEAAGLLADDRVVEFDGETVRSARQFARLVQETPPGRQVNVVVVRGGQRTTLAVAPTAGPSADDFIEPRVRERLGELRDRMPNFDFDFDFDVRGFAVPGRLGVQVQELTPQLAAYFGATEGVLVAAVTADSPASRAGLRAGDVITSVGGDPVGSRSALLRELRDRTGEIEIGIVRDRKAQTVSATIERPQSRGRLGPVV